MLTYQMPTFNIDTVTKQQQTFLCEFVDIKRNGFRHYVKALNNLTYNFWAPTLAQQEKSIDELAESMKFAIRHSNG